MIWCIGAQIWATPETAKAIENGKPGYGPYEVEKKAYEEWRVETITRRDSIYNTPAL